MARVPNISTATPTSASTVLGETAGVVRRFYKDALGPFVNVKDPAYGAVGDGVTDDTAAIQAALNAVPAGGSVYFPKAGGGGAVGPSYVITAGLTLTKNDVTLFSDPISEYSEGLVTSAAIDMLTVSGYGLTVRNLGFTGNGTADVFSGTNGIVIDRSSVADAETYSNLDATVEKCTFFNLNDALTGIGRNVNVFTNTFSQCKRGVVGELHTYGGGTVSEFRGWRITGNRFHGMGSQYLRVSSAEPEPANLAALDSWCIQMPQTSAQTSHLEIFDNNADYCGAGFYKGYMAGAKIQGNQTHKSNAIFVYAYISDASNQTNCSNYVNVISGNTINSRSVTSVATRGYQFSLNSIVVLGVSNLVVCDNAMHNAMQSHMLITACARATVKGNVCSQGNNQWNTDATQRPCIVLDQSANVTCTDNKVWSVSGDVHDYGIQATTCTGLKVRDNTIMASTVPVSAAATDLRSAADDGLPWQTPTMLNAFTLTAGSYGYRKLFNGRVQILVNVAAGADNQPAFQLPAGYRPTGAIAVPNVGIFANAYAAIETGGLVYVNWEAGAATSYSIICEFEAA